MRCGKARKLLPLHAGGDLAARAEEGLRAHLEVCETCRSRLDEFVGHRQRLFVLKGASGPAPDLWPDVARRIREERAPRRRVPILPVAASILIAAGLALWGVLAQRAGPPEGEAAASRGASTVLEEPAPAGAGEAMYLLAEVGPAAGMEAGDPFPSVVPPDSERGAWDDF